MAQLTPIPAATVTLVRDTETGPEVLMMQRNFSSGFVPGAYVFPGGAVDDADSAAELSATCHGLSESQASAALGVSRGGLAYWVAAIREAFEEAGMLMAYDAEGRLLVLDDALVIERFRRHRHALNQGRCGMLDIVHREELTLAADRLVYFSHWITPAHAPRRYDTRFFVAAAPPTQVPLHDNQETIDHVWVRPADALSRNRQEDFKMRFPTIRTLESLAAYASVDALMKAMRAERDIPTILPRISAEGARLLPGDEGYEELVTRELEGRWKI